MGLLKDAKILPWLEKNKNISNYKKLGIYQFIRMYNQYKFNSSIPFYWGYEMEYMLLKKINNNYKLNLIGSEVINKISIQNECWLPEYANWMIEKIPKNPFDNRLTNLLLIDNYLQIEITKLNKNLDTNSKSIMLTSFPLIGVEDFYVPIEKKYNNYSESVCVPDNIINPHIRFKTLTENIRKRRNRKVNIKIPIFKDINTKDESIVMDCMAFGMGSCCSQVTIQCHNLDHALKLYDQFAIISPFLLSLSAACPILKGTLSNHDSRWNVIEQAVDDRQESEHLKKSRYSTISYFIHNNGQDYNNINHNHNKYYHILKKNNIPNNLAVHISYLFERDPLIMYENDLDDIKENNIDGTTFFTNINSSNWNNVRLKPPSNNNDGWKVEIRILDMQTTSFGNTSFFVFINLLAKVLFYFNLDLYIPISQVDENFKLANVKNSIYSKYLCKEDITNPKSRIVKKSLSEIIDILLMYIYKYLDVLDNEQITKNLSKYLEHIRGLSNGSIKTDAKKMRDFVVGHSDYKKDSIVTQSISDDLIDSIMNMNL